MDKRQFTALSLPQALAVIFDAFPSLALMDAPPAPRPVQMPRYDTRCRTKGGTVYASECDLGQLQYYFDRAMRGTDPKYFEKNQKEAKSLGYFLEWRAVNPNARWEGERFNQGVVTALAPSSRPRVTEWEPREDKREPSRESDLSENDDFLFGGVGK